eukprot:SAG22_NODE_14162_length_383_cov_0.542254_1_plen_102_part_01
MLPAQPAEPVAAPPHQAAGAAASIPAGSTAAAASRPDGHAAPEWLEADSSSLRLCGRRLSGKSLLNLALCIGLVGLLSVLGLVVVLAKAHQSQADEVIQPEL